MNVTGAPTPFHSITPIDVFLWAGALQKVIVIALLAATLAAVVVLAMKVSSGRRLAGGSAFLSGLRLGGPIIGCLGACASMFSATVGYATAPANMPITIMAPGFAEAFLQLGVGFFAGAVAVLAHWVVESRIDRQVLGP